jgi:uncharacterized protein (TIGR03437 family)
MKTSVLISLLFVSFSVSAPAQSQPSVVPKFTIVTVAGNGTAGFSGDGGQAINASLNTPPGVAADAAGTFYIIDSLNNRIRKVTSDGTITTVAGTGVAGFGGDGGAATGALLNQPGRGAFDQNGNLYFADQNRVRKIAPDGTISTVAGNGSTGYTGDGGPAISASLSLIADVVPDATGNLFVADQNNNVVRKVDPDGIISTVAGNGTQGFSGDGGLATAASLNGPVSAVVNAGGDLFICDQQNNRIRKVSNGIITTVAGTGPSGFSGDGGPATSAQLSDPAGIRFDDVGNLYIAERVGNRIRVLRTNGIIETVAGNGTSGYGGDGGIATSASLSIPRGLATYAGLVYIADSNNQRIRLLVPPPSISTGGITPIDSPVNTIQPGSWISIYGSNFALTSTIWNGNFPTQLGSVSVTINNKPAYPWYVSPTQLNVQAPDDSATGNVPVVVTTPFGTASSTVTLGPYAPSFSLFSGKYPAAIVGTSGPGNSGAGYDYIGPAGAFSFPSRPVAAGETLILFGVGFGPTNPTVKAGQAFSGAAPCVTLPQITIGGVTATVAFAGIVEAGLYQFNVVVPNAGSGDQLLQASIGGEITPVGIYVTLQ